MNGLESSVVNGSFELMEGDESFEIVDDGIVIVERDDRIGMEIDLDVSVLKDVLNLEWRERRDWTSWMRLEAISSCRMKSFVLMMIR